MDTEEIMREWWRKINRQIWKETLFALLVCIVSGVSISLIVLWAIGN